MAREMQEKRVELPNGLSTHYYEWPGDGPRLLFLHPSAGYGRIWEWVVEALGDQFHVFAPDQRGHGHSGRPEGGYSAEEYADDVELFMRAVGIEKAIIVGHSLGGRVAQVFAARYPHRAAALLLIAVHLSNFHVTREATEKVLRDATGVLDHPEIFASKEEAFAFMRERWPWSPDPDEALNHRIAHNFVVHDDGRVAPRYDRVRLAQGLAHLSADLRPYAAKVECPVTIFRADRGALSFEQAAELAKFWRDAQVIEIPGAYALQLESPEALAKAISTAAATAEVG